MRIRLKRLKLNLATEYVILFAVLIFLALLVLIYYFTPTTALNGFITFLSGASTAGILILTAFYVIYTNRQLREIQKQRQLNIQPLPNISISDGIVLSPRLTTDPTKGGKIGVVVDFFFKANIKNIGNGAAVLVDVFARFTGEDVKQDKDRLIADRFITIEEKEIATIDIHVRDDNYFVINSLNKGFDGPCGRDRIFDAMLKINVLYKNILGAGFLYTLHNALFISEQDKKKLSDWIGRINSFDKEFNSMEEKYSAIYKRDRKEAHQYFEELKEAFYGKASIGAIDIAISPLTQSFRIEQIDEKSFSSLSDKIYHGVPISGRKNDTANITTLVEWKNSIIKTYFGTVDGAKVKSLLDSCS